MIAPADTASPPNAFTPSRFDVESRPFRDEPPPFLCAMVRRGYQLLGCRHGIGIVLLLFVLLLGARTPGRELHLGDLQHRQQLTVSRLPRVPGLGPVLEHLDLL